MKAKTPNTNHQNSTWFQVTGECMSPLIRKEDLVLSIPATKIEIGDVVIIPGPTPAVHRVVKISNSDHLFTKGDNSLSLDLPITRQYLTGKVIAIVKRGNKPIYIEGRSWKIKNYLMAKYSFACYSVWKLLSYNNFTLNAYTRVSRSVKSIHVFIASNITRFKTIRSK